MDDKYLVFLGDIHGEFHRLDRILRRFSEDRIVQVGDMGIGFPHFKRSRRVWVPDLHGKDPEAFDSRLSFIRGNHDNPAACRAYPNYLGDWGYDESLGVFFVSGGESSDRAQREEGRDWWPDEQLNDREMQEAIALYARVRPRVVVSHECPSMLMPMLHSHHPTPSRTSEGLQAMLDIHHPDLWAFGHHHKTWEKRAGTLFVCLAINQARRFAISHP
jgi:predicted phosphodiesterase